MHMLAAAIEQMVLERAVRVHRVVEVAAKALQLVRAVEVGLDLALVEGVRLFEVYATDVTTLLKAVAILDFCNFLYSFDPEFAELEAYLPLLDFLAEVYSLSGVEYILKENALVTLVENVQRLPVQEVLHQVTLVLVAEDVLVYAPVF